MALRNRRRVPVCSRSPAFPARADVSVNVRMDFADLDEYGEWYKLPRIGWVWAPDADPGWRPFVYGRWEWTPEGWGWIADEPFGWIVCHYGNWYYDDDIGWVWVPGYDWSPARVQWVDTDYEIAWAPLPPPPPWSKSPSSGTRHGSMPCATPGWA